MDNERSRHKKFDPKRTERQTKNAEWLDGLLELLIAAKRANMLPPPLTKEERADFRARIPYGPDVPIEETITRLRIWAKERVRSLEQDPTWKRENRELSPEEAKRREVECIEKLQAFIELTVELAEIDRARHLAKKRRLKR